MTGGCQNYFLNAISALRNSEAIACHQQYGVQFYAVAVFQALT
jgi:hypothetical protein